ncbi:MAG: exonuclease, partial [Rhodospirillaceae bacterium]
MHGPPEHTERGETLFEQAPDRTGRHIVALLFTITGVTATAAAAVLPTLMVADGAQSLAQEEGVVMAGLVACTVFWLWSAVYRCLLRPAERLAADIHLLAANVTGSILIDGNDYPDLDPLPGAINALTTRLAATIRDVDNANAFVAKSKSETNTQLTAILRDLPMGVLVCNLQHHVVLHNPAALRLLRVDCWPDKVTGDGHDLFSLMLAEPVYHTFYRLTRQAGLVPLYGNEQDDAARFIAGTLDGATLFDGRMTLILHGNSASLPGLAFGGGVITGYVLAFTDATHELTALGQRDALLRATTEDLRVPLANLRAVVDTLTDNPDLDAPSRIGFEKAIAAECESLTDRLEGLVSQYRVALTGNWPMCDLRSRTVIELVRHRVMARKVVTINQTGIPCRLHGDSFSLVALLDHLIDRLGVVTGVAEFDLSAEPAARWIFFDLTWRGTAVGAPLIDLWKAEPLPAALGGLTVGDVLRHHRSDLWSDTRPDGLARL